MSTGPFHERSEQGSLQLPHATRDTGELLDKDDDVTPKSEVPAPVPIQHISPLDSESFLANQHDGAAGDYFALQPSSMTPGQQERRQMAPRMSGSEERLRSNPTEMTSLRTSESRAEDSHQRPSLATSSEHSDSGKATASGASSSDIGDAKVSFYPNQAFAALHNQRYPVRRQQTLQPGQILTWTSAVASTFSSGSYTTSNTPTATPGNGLFSPPIVRPQLDLDPSSENPGTYASPYLHFTHRQVPKETHIADVDVDPVSGRKLINHYEIVDELGRGTHGKVKLGRDLKTESTHVAIKIVERYSKRRKLGKLTPAEDKVKKEVAILKKARHPNIVALLEVIDDPSRKKVYIVLEWVARGEILWRVKSQFRELALMEARRYEKERSGTTSERLTAEDQAVLREVQLRLVKKQRSELRKFRRGLRDAPDHPNAFSHELAGDHESETSEDDVLSKVSTATEDMQLQTIHGPIMPEESRLPSRVPSPLLGAAAGAMMAMSETARDYLASTSNPNKMEDDRTPPANFRDKQLDVFYADLEGTWYGAYDSNSRESSRAPSIHRRSSQDHLARIAEEILDSDLNPELEYVPVMTQQQTRVAFRDTLLGLQYLHYQGIVHRDIKPPNLLSTIDHRVKISDFGVSYLGRPIEENEPGEEISEHEAQELDEARELAKTVGTPAFYAPELCSTDLTEDPLPVTKAIDVWALGITLFCMLFARTPFVDNEFVVMRQIADEEVYIPRKRLLPIVLKAQSRPPSHQRGQRQTAAGRRNHHEILYEEIGDELYDLLRRLLTKDPRKRITLEEVRHHPFVVADLPDKVKWLEETDPTRANQFKKIEVSKEDVNAAVVPLHILDRVRSGIKAVGERLGLAGRSRPRSNTGSDPNRNSPSPSASSSSTTISQDARRQSLRVDESIFSALKKSRETDHGSNKSSASSPKSERKTKYFDLNADDGSTDSYQENKRKAVHSRPRPPERSKTIMSTTGSVRTLKQSDFPHGNRESPPPSPGLPGTPVALDTPDGSAMGVILGSGPARHVLKALRDHGDRGAFGLSGNVADRASVEALDVHTVPSLAISNTSVSGEVNLPELLKSVPPYSTMSVAESQDTHGDTARADPFLRDIGETRPNHDRLQDARGPKTTLAADQSDVPMPTSQSHHTTLPQSNDQSYGASGRDSARSIERYISDADDTCDRRPRRGSRDIFTTATTRSESHETDFTSHTSRTAPAFISSSSDFGSAVSMSISHPSVPSAISEMSSFDPRDDPDQFDDEKEKRNHSSDGTIDPGRMQAQESIDDGYHPDFKSASNSDEEDYESSSDSDGGLLMTRRKVFSSGQDPKKPQLFASHDPPDPAKSRHRRRSSGSVPDNDR